MKALIICFSLTGNTWKVGANIREGILKSGHDCEIIPLKNFNVDSLKEYDLIGLGCPVYYYKEPFHIRRFIQNLPDLEGQQWFIFCSHGSVMGATLLSMAATLKERGAHVIGSHHTYADGTLPFYPYPTVTTGHPDEKGLVEAVEFGIKIAICSVSVSVGDCQCIKEPLPVTEDWAVEEADLLSEDFLSQVMPALAVNSELCTRCGTCEDQCPVNGISIDAEPPVIQSPCIYCYHCVNVCPVCAIEADWSPMIDMARSNYRRYIEALKNAESRGEFTWHVDPATMDFDNPLYKQRLKKMEEK